MALNRQASEAQRPDAPAFPPQAPDIPRSSRRYGVYGILLMPAGNMRFDIHPRLCRVLSELLAHADRSGTIEVSINRGVVTDCRINGMKFGQDDPALRGDSESK